MALLIQSFPKDIDSLLLSRIADLANKQRGIRASTLSIAPSQDFMFFADEKPQADLATIKASAEVTSDADDPPPPPDVVTLLSPAKSINDALAIFTNTYPSISSAFSTIFVYPYVGDMKLPSLGDSSSVDSELGSLPSNLREFFLNVNGDYRAFVDFEITMCRNLVGYASLVDTLIRRQTISDFYDSITPVIDRYVQKLGSKNAEKAAIFLRTIKVATTLSSTIGTAVSQMRAFTPASTRTFDISLDSYVVGSKLREILKDLFNLEGSDNDAFTKLSIILGVEKYILHEKFSQVIKRDYRHRVAQVITTFATRLDTLKSGLGTLAASLTSSIEANDVLTDVWTGVGDNFIQLSTLEAFTSKPSPGQVTKISRNWAETKTQVQLAIGVLTGATISANAVGMNAAGTASAGLGIPRSAAELKMFDLIESVGAEENLTDPKKYAILSQLALDESVVERVTEKVLAPSMDLQPASDLDADQQKELEEKISYLGPTNDVKDALDKLQGDCRAIVKTFSSILQLPNLDQLQILNPFKTSATPSEPERRDIRYIVLKYQTAYEILQAESVACIRGLIAYASFSIAALPRVTPFSPRVGQIGLDDYLEGALKITARYQEEAASLSAKYTKFGQEWKLAQDNLENAIKKSEQDAEAAKKALETEEEKYKKQTIMGVLEIFGALVLFAVGAFTMPYGLLLMAGGGYLLYKGIKDLKGLSDIRAAIDSFKSILKTTEETNKALTALKAPMQAVANAVTKVTRVWSDIATNLAVIQGHMLTWDVPATFKITVAPTIQGWIVVKGLCLQYIGLITGSIPIS